MIFKRALSFLFVLHCAALSLRAVPCYADGSVSESGADPEKPEVSIELVDIKGAIRDSGWETSAHWTWISGADLGQEESNGSAPSDGPTLFPVLIVDAEVSKGLAITGWGKVGKGIQVLSPASMSKEDSTSHIRLQLNAFDQALEIETIEKGVKTKVSMTVDVRAAPDPLLVHESCASESIAPELIPSKVSSPPRFVAVQCVPFEDKEERGFRLYIHYFSDTKVSAVTVGQPAEESRKGSYFWTGRKIVVPQKGWKVPEKSAEIPLGGFSVDSASGRGKMAEYRISYKGDLRRRRWSFFAGTGATYLSYFETPGPIEIQELLWTLKGGTDFSLVPGKFSLGASAFVNAIVLSQSPESVSAARFFGINGRFTYHLPLKLPAGYRLSAAVGKYLWGTVVSGSGYGIKLLSGYQIFVQGTYDSSGVRKAAAYIKFSPISESALGISFSNFEFALGGVYRLSPAKVKRFPLSVTVDWSVLRINEVESVPNTAKLGTLSLGVATEF